MKGFRTAGTPDGPEEWSVECYYGDEPPDNSPGWQPLYSVPAVPAIVTKALDQAVIAFKNRDQTEHEVIVLAMCKAALAVLPSPDKEAR